MLWIKFKYSLTQSDPGWPRLTQADPGWPRLAQADPVWPRLTQADPGWPRLTHRLTPLPNLLSVPAELQPLQQGAVGSYGGNQVLKLDLQGDPLRCSDSQHAQILEQRRQKNDCPSFYYLYCSPMINFALTLLVRDIYKILYLTAISNHLVVVKSIKHIFCNSGELDKNRIQAFQLDSHCSREP